MKNTKKTVNRDIYVSVSANNANSKITFEKIYWMFYAGFGLLIGCFFLVVNFMF